MATDRHGRAEEVVERYGRRARWLHAGTYLTVLALMFTGIWLLLGHEGSPSPLSSIAGMPDTRLHVWIGWVFLILLGVGVLSGLTSAGRFVSDSVRFRRADFAWIRAWPKAIATGRFPWHSGRFDPGQRIANIALVLGLAAVTASGVAMALLHGGPAFVWLVPIHKWSTYALVPLIAGHVLIASGVLPGYRGVWRSMHLGGRLRVSVAKRLWPAWTDEHVRPRNRAGIGGR
jgi:cytochrome b subunit of formate dehydrogenase